MSNQVIIKGKNDRLVIALNPKSDFLELCDILKTKILEAKNFIGNSRMAIEFSGRKLTSEEEDILIGILTENSNIVISYIFTEKNEKNEKNEKKSKEKKSKDQAMDYFPDVKDMRYTSRRINVTQRAIFTKTLAELDVRKRFGVTITRVYRAGIEFVPAADTKLQFGDTITVIGDESHIQLVSKEFGNSKRRMQTPHIAELFMGITLGVLLGSIPFAIPGIPVPVKLGLAGGPLIVAILISRYGGKFSVTHYVSQSANLMVREIGIVLFLASVGLDAGATFIETILHGQGLYWMCLGALITLIPLIITSLVARFRGKLDYLGICGLLSGASTDPPALAFANDMSNSEIPALTYASVYPLTTFLRIMVAQLLIVFFV